MFHKAFSLTGMLLLSGAVVLGTAQTSLAASHGGGGHGGGGHGGGGRSYSGGHSYGHAAGYGHGSGYSHGGYGYGHGYGYGRHYPYYGGYGYGGWGGYGYNPYSYPYSTDYGYSSYPYTTNYSYPTYSSPAVNTDSYDSYSPAPDIVPESIDTSAHLTVTLPPAAVLWFNGTKMRTGGSVREFDTPPLAAGRRFNYAVTARWMDNGREMKQTQQVIVSPNSHVNVRFPTSGIAR